MVEILKAKEKDLTAAFKILEESIEYHKSRIPDLFVENKLEIITNAITEDLDNNEYIILVAKDREQVVGVIYGGIRQRGAHYKNRDAMYVFELAVRQENKKQGIGKMLYSEFKNETKKLGIEDIELNVYNGNVNAIEFYKHLGLEMLCSRMIDKA